MVCIRFPLVSYAFYSTISLRFSHSSSVRRTNFSRSGGDERCGRRWRGRCDSGLWWRRSCLFRSRRSYGRRWSDLFRLWGWRGRSWCWCRCFGSGRSCDSTFYCGRGCSTCIEEFACADSVTITSAVFTCPRRDILHVCLYLCWQGLCAVFDLSKKSAHDIDRCCNIVGCFYCVTRKRTGEGCPPDNHDDRENRDRRTKCNTLPLVKRLGAQSVEELEHASLEAGRDPLATTVTSKL